MRWTEFVERVKGFFADALVKLGQWETGIPLQRTSTPLDRQVLRYAPVVAPRVDCYENEKEYLLRVDLPGVARRDVELFCDNSMNVVLFGQRKTGTRTTIFREIQPANWYREFRFPLSIAEEKVKATLKQGVLEIRLPKVVRNTARMVRVIEVG